jgi:catechol 2,3-dioxygenase-like lactoylglutathione lyase family enzyme
MIYPRGFNHIGLSVPDVDAAFKWYTEVLGLYPIMKPTTIKKDDSAIGVMCTDVFGPDWTSFRICHLATADRIGIEIFEFPNNVKPANNLPLLHHRSGYRGAGQEDRRDGGQAAHADPPLLPRRKALSHGLLRGPVGQHRRDLLAFV